MLVASLNTPIQNPMQIGFEMQFKQQQQVKLQELYSKINAQKQIQQQIQQSDPVTANMLKQGMINNEMNRLREQINKPVIPSTPMDTQQQLILKAQQKQELDRLVQTSSSGELLDLKMQNVMSNVNAAQTTSGNILKSMSDSQQGMFGNLR
jgi:hypothetical protein